MITANSKYSAGLREGEESVAGGMWSICIAPVMYLHLAKEKNYVGAAEPIEHAPAVQQDPGTASLGPMRARRVSSSGTATVIYSSRWRDNSAERGMHQPCSTRSRTAHVDLDVKFCKHGLLLHVSGDDM